MEHNKIYFAESQISHDLAVKNSRRSKLCVYSRGVIDEWQGRDGIVRRDCWFCSSCMAFLVWTGVFTMKATDFLYKPPWLITANIRSMKLGLLSSFAYKSLIAQLSIWSYGLITLLQQSSMVKRIELLPKGSQFYTIVYKNLHDFSQVNDLA